MATANPNKRISRNIGSPSELINIKADDITASFIMETFADFAGKDNSKRIYPYDVITIPVGKYTKYDKYGKPHTNKNSFKTTAGKWIFNVYFIESDPQISAAIGWVDKDVTKKVFEGVMDQLTYAIMEDRLDRQVYKKFLMRSQFFMQFVSVFTPTYTNAMLTITTPLNKRKAELLKEHKEEIDKGDIKVLDKISKELLDYAREILKDDPSMDMYNSGAGGDFDNNFKNMFIMRGSVKDPDPTKGYNIITSNYIDGVSKEEYYKLANTLAAGPYARSKKTEVGGYWEKLFLSAFQHVVLLEEGSDCGTKRYIEVDVTKKNIKDIMYCYVIEGDKLTEITSENMNRFIGKRIKLRFASMCEAKNGICNACAGNIFYRLGIKNIGTATPQVASKLKLRSMKLFHDDQISFAEMDPMHAFGLD